MVGLGVVGLFALVVIGLFFGKLATNHAALLFFAPLLCAIPELPYLRRMGPRLRGFAKVLLATAPIALVLILAFQKFNEDATKTSGDANQGSVEDYMNYGK
jgi:hypothetical protein